ncbi:hypothetical protein ACIQXD_05215 [Streptomyces uncialis]|uniref:hypothetical protein n=1 Tax=Streptomyces uncialis TaxID=1048205 RepID=UPI00380DBB4E
MTSSHGVHRDLAAALRGQAQRAGEAATTVRGSDWRLATVTVVGTDGTVTADGIPARRMETYARPAVGDTILLTQSSSGNWAAAGRLDAGPGTAIGVPAYAYKAAATDRASTTTPAADPDLVLPLAATGVYVVEMHLLVGGPAAGLLVTQWQVPAGATGLKGAHGPASTAAGTDALTNAGDNIPGRFGAHGFGTTVTYGRRNTNTNLLYAIETGVVTTTGTAGNCAVAWAQSASNATPTRMGAGSWMRATRIG